MAFLDKIDAREKEGEIKGAEIAELATQAKEKTDKLARWNQVATDATVAAKTDPLAESRIFAICTWRFTQRWFHYIFDPTANDQSVEPQRRFWKFLAFRKPEHGKTIDEIVRILSIPRPELSYEDQLVQDGILKGYMAILNKPFQPHAVARTRHLAYQYSVVMKYLDNLIAWGDHLFQQDTMESINEATQIYVLAANILGERPQRIPPRGTVKAKSFAQLKRRTRTDRQRAG